MPTCVTRARPRALCDLVGASRALELCVTSRPVTAVEADRMGLVNLVVGATAIDDAVGSLTAALLTAPREAVTETKALIAQARLRDRAEQLLAERRAQVRLIRSRLEN